MQEITAEYETAEIAPTAQLHTRLKFRVGAKTDMGRVRENNEDKYEFFVPSEDHVLASRGAAFIVCDGMGGAEAGQIASELAVKTFLDAYYHTPSNDPTSVLSGAVRSACRFMISVGKAVPSRKGMGTTLSALVLLQDTAYVCHVGDSRIYRLRDGATARLTHDHTWVDEMVAAGKLTEAEASVHPYRHVITRAISTDAEVEPDVTTDSVQAGDVYMLCSDGLVNHVADSTIHEVLSSEGPSEAAWKLVALALQGGGSDNVTVIVVHVDEVIAVDASGSSTDASSSSSEG